MFAFETIEQESDKQHKSFKDHLLHLFTHSFLHLLCYEHYEEKDRIEMERLEVSYIRAFWDKKSL